MQPTSRHIAFLLVITLVMLQLAGCVAGESSAGETEPAAGQPGCSASLLTRDGSRIELAEITSQALHVSALIPQTFGARAVELKPSAIEQVTWVQGRDQYEIQLRDFATLTGTLAGSLEGTTQQGDQTVEWANIREAAITCEPEQEYTPPPGVEAVFYDAGAGSIPLYGLVVVQSYCTPSGEPVNGYQMCINGSETEHVLRVNVSQDGNVYIEYEIPLATLTSMSWADGIQYQSPLLGPQTLRGEFHTSWALRPEGTMMGFEGENAFGTWTIVPTGDFRVDFPQPAAAEPPAETPDTVGTCTTTEGETLRVVAVYAESNQQEGFITAVRPDGIRMNIPLNGLSELSLDQ